MSQKSQNVPKKYQNVPKKIKMSYKFKMSHKIKMSQKNQNVPKKSKYPKKSKCPKKTSKKNWDPTNSKITPFKTAPYHNFDFTSAPRCLRLSTVLVVQHYPHRSGSRSTDKRKISKTCGCHNLGELVVASQSIWHAKTLPFVFSFISASFHIIM